MKLFFAIVLLPLWLQAQDIFDNVESVDIGLNGYALGKALTESQKAIAKKNPETANVSGTYKFKDGDLFIVADDKTDRVVVLYEPYMMLNNTSIKQIVSRAIGRFEDPTTVTHGNIIYWFYRRDGHKYTSEEFEAWRATMLEKVTPKHQTLADAIKNPNGGSKSLDKLVTVKLSSDRAFNEQTPFLDGSGYLMISSEALISQRYHVTR